MFQLEQLARHNTFSKCRFYTSIKDREITELAVFCPWERAWEKDALYLLSEEGLVSFQDSPEALLRKLASSKAAGILLRPTSLEAHKKSLAECLTEGCCKYDLVLGELPPDVDFTKMIREFHGLLSSSTNGETGFYEEVLQTMRDRFLSNGVNGLLEELSFWSGSQVALVLGQDTYVYPRTPVLEPAVFSLQGFCRTASPSRFSGISQFYSPDTKAVLLQTELYNNKLHVGQLLMLGNPQPFTSNDCLLLNYASIFCSEMNDLNRSSKQIQAVLDALCNGQPVTNEQLELLPEQGYALILKGTEQTHYQDGSEDYLAYLIHHFFPKNISYSLEQGCIRIFAAAKDAETFVLKLIHILKEAGELYHTGISRMYKREQAVTAFSEANHAASMAELLDYGQRPCYFYELGIYRLFSYPENEWPVNQMLGEMDQLLSNMDREKRNLLTTTMRTFADNNFNYQKTADKLFTHVNTVRYRIRILEDVWGVDLGSDDGKLLFGILAKLLPLWIKHTGQEVVDVY